MGFLRKIGIGIVDANKDDLTSLESLLNIYNKIQILKFENYALEEFLNPSTKKIMKKKANRIEKKYLDIKYCFTNPGKKEKKAKVYLTVRYVDEVRQRSIGSKEIKKTIERYIEIEEFEVGTKNGSQKIVEILLKDLKKKIKAKQNDKELWDAYRLKLKDKNATDILKFLTS